MDFAAIRNTIFDWVEAALDNPAVTIYWEEPKAPRPPEPALRLSFLQGPTTIGIDEIRNLPSNPQGFKILGQRQMILSTFAYGELSFQLISDLQTSISDPAMRAILQSVNISVLSTSAMRDVTAPLETEYERRAQMDFTMLVSEEKDIEPGAVRTISLASEISDIEGSIIAEE